MTARPKPAKWWLAWYPVRCIDSGKIVWLRRVYREWWYQKSYFEHPSFTKENSNDSK